MVFCLPSKRLFKRFRDHGHEEVASTSTSSNTKFEKQPAQPAVSVQFDKNMVKRPRIAIVFYSMYGHITSLAEAVKSGIENSGGNAEIYQVAETLSDEVLAKMHAPPKPNYPVLKPADLAYFDAFVMGIPTRFGNFPAQWKTFWDATGQLWATGSLAGKYAAFFISAASPGGGQESTAVAAMSTLAHHGMLYVPLGYSRTFAQLSNLMEIHGGSPWGAGTFAGVDGSRQPTALELEIATIQGQQFYDVVSKAF